MEAAALLLPGVQALAWAIVGARPHHLVDAQALWPEILLSMSWMCPSWKEQQGCRHPEKSGMA